MDTPRDISGATESCCLLVYSFKSKKPARKRIFKELGIGVLKQIPTFSSCLLTLNNTYSNIGKQMSLGV